MQMKSFHFYVVKVFFWHLFFNSPVSIPTEGKICFSQFTPFYEVECEKLFCKTNLKLNIVKIIK